MPGIPQIGGTVGDFRLPGGHLDGDTFHRRDYTLCEQRGKPLVLAFYPGDDTPVCTAQLCSHSGRLDQLQSAGATVWGIAPKESTATNSSPATGACACPCCMTRGARWRSHSGSPHS